jgi:hypothetical protein
MFYFTGFHHFGKVWDGYNLQFPVFTEEKTSNLDINQGITKSNTM